MDNFGIPFRNINKAPIRERRGYSGSTIKLVAIITMLIDHTAAVVLEKVISHGETSNAIAYDSNLYFIYVLMRLIGRLAFPLFCFLLVEGFLHTRSVKKYALRLAAFALISEIPFDLALFGKAFFFNYQNVYFTLLIGLLVLIGFKYVSEKAADKKWMTVIAIIGAIIFGYTISFATINIINNINGLVSQNGGIPLIPEGTNSIITTIGFTTISILLYMIIARKNSVREANIKFVDLGILIVGMILADVLMTDYSGFGVLTIAVIYGLRKSHMKSMLGGCVTLTLMSFGEFTCFLDLILIQRYNGKRGINLKYVFYAFYPVHLFLLYLVCVFMKLV